MCRPRKECFDDQPHAVHELLSNWGGEGIYFATGAQALKPVLERLGTPTIIALSIPVERSWREQSCNPDLVNALLGTFFRKISHTDVFHPANIPAQDVLGIWQTRPP